MATRFFDNPAAAAAFLGSQPSATLRAEAFRAQQQRHGRQVSYIHNLHINPTNLCVYDCAFCDFARRPGQEGAYSLDEDSILARINEHRPQEVHIVGGLWKTWGLQRHLQLIRLIHDSFPHVAIKACTAVEVAYFAHMEQTPVVQVLEALQKAGVAMLPGGGAEVLTDRIHQALHRQKITPAQWLDIHRQAHALGLPTNATLLFGHIETPAEVLEHLQKIRDLQDDTGGFVSFIPLLYQPGTSQLVRTRLAPQRVLDIIALCRLYLDNIAHIKAYWPTLGLATTAMALTGGANDMDGTLGTETIMHMADADAPRQLSTRQAEQLVRDAGMQPVRRDGRHCIVADDSP